MEFSKFSLYPHFETLQLVKIKITNHTQLMILIDDDLLIKHTVNAIQWIGIYTYEITV